MTEQQKLAIASFNRTTSDQYINDDSAERAKKTTVKNSILPAEETEPTVTVKTTETHTETEEVDIYDVGDID